MLVAYVCLARAPAQVAHLARAALLVGVDAAVGNCEQAAAFKDVRKGLARQVAVPVFPTAPRITRVHAPIRLHVQVVSQPARELRLEGKRLLDIGTHWYLVIG